MPILLRNTSVSAAFDARIPCNLLHEACPVLHNVDISSRKIEMSVTVSSASEAITSVQSFIVVDNLQVDVLFGGEWEDFTMKYGGK